MKCFFGTESYALVNNPSFKSSENFNYLFGNIRHNPRLYVVSSRILFMSRISRQIFESLLCVNK